MKKRTLSIVKARMNKRGYFPVSVGIDFQYFLGQVLIGIKEGDQTRQGA